MYRILRRTLPLLLLVIAASACGSAGGGSSSGTSRNSSLLTSAEMAETRLGNLYEIVERLRPRWLQVRGVASLSGVASMNTGSQIVVYLNSKYVGGPEVLKEFQPSALTEVRYLDGPRASATLQGYPDGAHVAGAIVMVTTPIGR